MKSKKNDPEFQAKVRELLDQENLSGIQVAERLGVSYTTIQRTARLIGCCLGDRRRRHPDSPATQWQKVHRLLEHTNMSTREIANAIGITRERLHQLAYHNGYVIKYRNARKARGEAAAPDPDTGIRRVTSDQKKGYAEPEKVEPAKEPVIITTNDLNKLWKPARI